MTVYFTLDIPGAESIPAPVRSRFEPLLGEYGSLRMHRFFQAWRVAYFGGYAVAEEIRRAVENSDYLAQHNKAIKKAVMEDLPASGLVIKDVKPFFGPVRLTLIRLSQAGIELGREIGLDDPAPSEWQRVIDGHRGNDWERHMVGMLAFVWQARRRGYFPSLLPGLVNDVYPDVELYYQGDRSYAEFETGARAKYWKWRRLKKAHGVVRVCAFRKHQRERIVHECRMVGAPVMATDLETLLTTGDDSPLFVESPS